METAQSDYVVKNKQKKILAIWKAVFNERKYQARLRWRKERLLILEFVKTAWYDEWEKKEGSDADGC